LKSTEKEKEKEEDHSMINTTTKSQLNTTKDYPTTGTPKIQYEKKNTTKIIIRSQNRFRLYL